jgi:pimeloyl-ACP methyl ester carboxylesterase
VEPFVQLPFAKLPQEPRVPHPFFEVEERQVPVWTEALGDTVASVRVCGSGPPLLLVHGLMTTSYTWRYVIGPLSEHFTVYAPDLVGAGRTSKPKKRLTADNVVEWLDALQMALGIRGSQVVGNSMGGYLTVRWALKHPKSIRRLLVVHAPLVPMPRLYALWFVTRVPGVHSLLRYVVARSPEGWVHRNVHYWDESLKSREETREYGLPLATTDGFDGFFSQLRDTMNVFALATQWRSLISREDMGATFPMPLRFLYAKQDPMVPPAVGKRLEEVMHYAEMKWLEHGSHFAHVDAPDVFLAAALPFLKR